LSSKIDEIVLATSLDRKNKPLIELVESLGYRVVIGSENDVLQRFIDAVEETQADVVVRITGDCPLIDARIVDEVIQNFFITKSDYSSNVNPATYPDGLDVEVFSSSTLKKVAMLTNDKADREHVTKFIRASDAFSKKNLNYIKDLSELRWTVDEEADLHLVNKIFDFFSPDIFFDWEQVLNIKYEIPNFFEANKDTKRNEGSNMSSGQKLWKRAKQLIPGGNMLLSKRPDNFLPGGWPAYFSKSKGLHVWDLDDNKYIDVSIMGVGTNILGYGNDSVDNEVINTIKCGNMSTLNCPEEVYLAEKIIEMHPWADLAKFARSGGEANAMAIRIARAASGKDGVAFCGYHGWHDWYLAANLSDDQTLNGHLMSGLDPKGVPQKLTNTIVPFFYNDIESLRKILNQRNDIGVIKMEVQRNHEPLPGFLQSVRELASRNGIVLIFDECTSGFRETFGGLHLKYGVEPDLAVFGKAIGNGYPLTAVIGKKSVMDEAQATFISSTFWTDRIGPTASLKTLEIMEGIKSWELITNTGKNIKREWQKLADENELSIQHNGIPALASFSFNSDKKQEYKTFITQEMLKKGFLASTSIYVSICHDQTVISNYLDSLNDVFKIISECEKGNKDISTLIEGEVAYAGFRRLN